MRCASPLCRRRRCWFRSSELTQRGVPAKPAAGPRAQPVPCNAPKERLKKGLKEGAAGLAVRTIKRGRSQESPDGRRYMVAYIDCLSSEGTPLYRGERPASFVFLEYQHLYAGRARFSGIVYDFWPNKADLIMPVLDEVKVEPCRRSSQGKKSNSIDLDFWISRSRDQQFRRYKKAAAISHSGFHRITLPCSFSHRALFNARRWLM